MDVNFDELIDKYLERELKKKIIGRYYPSEAGQCIRKSWYSYKNPKDVDKDVVKVFQLGNMIHSFIVDVLSSQKNPDVELLESETPFELVEDDFTISGRIDDVILVKLNGKKYIVEVKSSKNIEYISKPSKTHEAQLMLYMHAKKIHSGIILYIDKRTLKTKSFSVKYEEDRARKIIEKIGLLHEYLKRNEIPPPEAKINGDTWMCKYCPYKTECDNSSE